MQSHPRPSGGLAVNAAVLLLCLLAAVLAACSNAKGTVIPTEVNKWEDLRGSLDQLSASERTLAVAYLDRTKAAAAYSGQPVPQGVTLGQAIENQKSFEQTQAQQRLTNRGQQEQSDQRRKDAEDRAAQVFGVKLTGKEIIGADFSTENRTDQVAFTFELRNNGAKELSEVKGSLTVSDSWFVIDLKVIPIDYRQPLAVGAVETWTARVPLSAQATIDQRIRNTDLSQMKVTFTPELVQFADGSRLDLAGTARG
jgi:hypothetical protein